MAVKPDLTVLSLGAGVQSTTLYLLALHGEIAKPDFAIFADTGWESQATYDHLAWLIETFGDQIPILWISGGDLREDTLAASTRFASMPLHVPPGAMLKRQCTTGYKLRPIWSALRDYLGVPPGKRCRDQVEIWIGLSIDEVFRMRPATQAWQVHGWPLIDRRMSRHDCLRWLTDHGYARPPKSSCLGCPYHDNAYWRDLRDHSPAEWTETVAWEEAVRRQGLPSVKSPVYLHRSLQPLAEVDLSTEAEHGQLDLFGEECMGVCGV